LEEAEAKLDDNKSKAESQKPKQLQEVEEPKNNEEDEILEDLNGNKNQS
jgi:hypothetical protein